MAIITPDGLFHGDRLRRCSQDAQLYWARYFIASNTCGRMELNYQKALVGAYASLPNPPSEHEFMSHMREYYKEFLLFVYSVDGQLWGQWDTPEDMLLTYKTKADKRSPAAPSEEMRAWQDKYKKVKAERAPRAADILSVLVEKKIPEISKTFQKIPHGLGVGVGVGEVRIGKGNTKAAPEALPEWLPPAIWQAYREMRKKLRKPMTPTGEALIVQRLDKLRNKGHPPDKVLEQSIMHSWQGVFELKEDFSGKNQQNGFGQSKQDGIRARNQQTEREFAAHLGIVDADAELLPPGDEHTGAGDVAGPVIEIPSSRSRQGH